MRHVQASILQHFVTVENSFTQIFTNDALQSVSHKLWSHDHWQKDQSR